MIVWSVNAWRSGTRTGGNLSSWVAFGTRQTDRTFISGMDRIGAKRAAMSTKSKSSAGPGQPSEGDPKPVPPPRPIEPPIPLPGEPVPQPPDVPPGVPPVPVDDPLPIPPQPIQTKRSRIALIRHSSAGVLTLLAYLPMALTVTAQVISPPEMRRSDIVVNPTMAECARGWTQADDPKWSKEKFDQFCAILKSPAPIVVNPTMDQCAHGWVDGSRWTKDQFDGFCTDLRKSK